MMRALLFWLSGRLPCRIISDEGRMYLERYYLCTLFGVRFYLHRFVGSDPDRGLHDHPWRWAVSLILAGWYWEETRCGIAKVRWVNGLVGDSLHRVILPSVDDEEVSCWTLFFHHERNVKAWGFARPLRGDTAGDLPAQRDAAAIRALLHSGCRIGEFLQVTVGDAMEALRVRYLYIPKEHRKGKTLDNMVYVTEALGTDLRELLRVRAVMVPGDARITDRLVVSRLRRPLSVRGFELRFKQLALAAGLPARTSPHWMRHTRAMNIMRSSTAKDPRGVVQSALAHVSIASSGIYTGTPREDVEKTLNAIDAPATRVTSAKLRRAWEGRVSV